MKVTRRDLLSSAAAGGLVAAAGLAHAAVGNDTPAPPAFDPDAEEQDVWQAALDALHLAAPRCRVEPDVLDCDRRRELRAQLEQAIADGSWERQKRYVIEYARTAADVAATFVGSPVFEQDGRIDASLATLASEIVERNSRLVRKRVRLIAKQAYREGVQA